MPIWEFKSDFSMKDTLKNMGMNDAFLPNIADFSGIDGTFDLFIVNVIHQAFVSVDEFGTEAAGQLQPLLLELQLYFLKLF